MNLTRLISWRLISLGIIMVLFLLAAFLIFLGFKNHDYGRFHHHQHPKYKITQDMMGQPTLPGNNLVDQSFTTHLPLIIIDTYGEEPKKDTVWDPVKRYRVPVDYDPNIPGKIYIIDNQYGGNHILDRPAIQSDIIIRLRGNSSLSFDKKQYLIKLVHPDGSKNKLDILGMGGDWEWIINISFLDKSLLRNYMCFNIAGEIMPHTPDVRYCELIMKNATDYTYQGVYLVMENIKPGPYRVNVGKYDPRDMATGYILRRDRYDETGTMLNNFATREQLTPGHLDIKYPYKTIITDSTIQKIENEISGFEQAIFSNRHQEFFKYANYIDDQSFIDYFIINEFFTNYDAGYNSTYAHKEKGGKICMGPVWDFDHAMDNFFHTKLNTSTTAMHNAPWIRQLLRDEEFTTKLIKRYHQLRKTLLSDENIVEYIDDTAAFLGPAQKRDWQRWGYFYTSKYLHDYVDETGHTIDRNTKSYKEELNKIKTLLIEHGHWLDQNIDSLYQFCDFTSDIKKDRLSYRIKEFILGQDNQGWLGGVGALAFILIFMVSIVLIQRD